MLEVADGGPGPLEVRPGGHGLDNVRRRLAGYYGEAARLTLERPEPGAETIARIELPL
jgi:sensor histidine kinase YesM